MMTSLAVFWVALGLTLAVLLVTVPTGGAVRLAQATLVLLLPHVFIGDLFHWRRFPRLGPSEKTRWVGLAVAGFALFLVFRQAGEYALPLFYVYFFGHFWKDLDIGLGQVGAASSPGLGSPKRSCGLLLIIGYTVIASGLVRDPMAIAVAKQVAYLISAGLLLFSLGLVVRGERGPVEVLWVRYASLSGGFLLVCTWLDALHPARSVLPHAIIVFHFMLWYVFYWSATWQQRDALSRAAPRRGLGGLSRSLPSVTALIVLVNLASVAAAVAYATSPAFHWLTYVYNFSYLAGCWTIMHVTWDWTPKVVKGIRLSAV